MSTDKVTQAQAFDALSVLVSYTPSEQSPTDAREALLDFIAQHPDEPAKPATLYDWSDPDIPDWAQCIATDDDGRRYAYAETPIPIQDFTGQYWTNGTSERTAKRLSNRKDLAATWRDSLEQRPQS